MTCENFLPAYGELKLLQLLDKDPDELPELFFPSYQLITYFASCELKHPCLKLLGPLVKKLHKSEDLLEYVQFDAGVPGVRRDAEKSCYNIKIGCFLNASIPDWNRLSLTDDEVEKAMELYSEGLKDSLKMAIADSSAVIFRETVKWGCTPSSRCLRVIQGNPNVYKCVWDRMLDIQRLHKESADEAKLIILSQQHCFKLLSVRDFEDLVKSEIHNGCEHPEKHTV